MNFHLRVLAPDDAGSAQQLIALFRVAFEENGSALPAREYSQRLLGKDDFHVVVALRNGAVIGGLTAYELEMFGSQTRELFVYDVAVAKEHRRQGVGSALLDCLKVLCRERGIASLYVGAIARESDAVRFYEATGLCREEVAWFSHDFVHSKDKADGTETCLTGL